MLIAIWAQNSSNILNTGYRIPGYTYGSLLAAFLLGIFTPVRSEFAIITGMLAGVVLVLILSFLGFPLIWFVPTGALTAILIAFLLDFFRRNQTSAEP